METRAGLTVALLLVSCAQPQISERLSEPTVAVSPTVAPQPTRQQRNTPRRLKLRLTLDRPEDLKVKVGDWVAKDQVISNRPSARANLIQELETLQQQLKQLPAQTSTSRYIVEQAEVAQARLKAELAREAIANFHTDSPWTDYARQVLALPDNDQLKELESDYQVAKGELAIAVAKLQSAQQQEIVKSDISAERADVLGKIQETVKKLDLLGIVRSPSDGDVKSIKWVGQQDQSLQAEITLVVKNFYAR